MQRYKRPENYEYLDVPRVTKSIWTSKQTGKEIKDSDKLLQQTQNYLTHGMLPLVQIMDTLMKSESRDAEHIFDLALDSYKLFVIAHKDFSILRKCMLNPAIAGKYKGLCGESTPIRATQLFGEDLEQQIKDIEQSNKICNKLSWTDKEKGYQSRGPRAYYNKFQSNKFQSQNKYLKGQYQRNSSFLDRKDPRHPNKSQKKGNLGRH